MNKTVLESELYTEHLLGMININFGMNANVLWWEDVLGFLKERSTEYVLGVLKGLVKEGQKQTIPFAIKLAQWLTVSLENVLVTGFNELEVDVQKELIASLKTEAMFDWLVKKLEERFTN